jgi:hypothetical protein
MILEEVVVTASLADSDDYYDIPSVTIRKQADFLVQNIRLVNDSRSPELRKKEIIETINNLIQNSKKIKNIELSYGDGFLEPIKLDDESLNLIKDRNRVDTSYVNIYVKVAYQENHDAKDQIKEIKEFITNSKVVGRTEIDELGDIGLSIVGPEQYRYEILAAISAENGKIKSAIGGHCEIIISGLEGRVEWERVSVGELMLFIGHRIEIQCK